MAVLVEKVVTQSAYLLYQIMKLYMYMLEVQQLVKQADLMAVEPQVLQIVEVVEVVLILGLEQIVYMQELLLPEEVVAPITVLAVDLEVELKVVQLQVGVKDTVELKHHLELDTAIAEVGLVLVEMENQVVR